MADFAGPFLAATKSKLEICLVKRQYPQEVIFRRSMVVG